MKKDNWRFEALARAKIVQQEEEARILRNTPEDFKPAEEIERLQNINTDLLEACKQAQVRIFLLDGSQNDLYVLLGNAIAKAKGD